MTSKNVGENKSIYYTLTDAEKKQALLRCLGSTFPEKYIVFVPDFNASIRCSNDHYSAGILPNRDNPVSLDLIKEAEDCGISRSSDMYWSIN